MARCAITYLKLHISNFTRGARRPLAIYFTRHEFPVTKIANEISLGFSDSLFFN